MASTKREFDETAALDAAMRVFWQHGYRNSTMGMLCSAMGLMPQSVYLWMGDKKNLFTACVRHYREALMPDLVLEMARDGADGLHSVDRLLKMWADWATHPDCNGCLITLGLSEFGDSDPEILGALLEFEDTVRRGLEKALEKAARSGELKPDVTPKSAARLLLTVHKGLMVGGRAGSVEGALETVRLLRSALMTS